MTTDQTAINHAALIAAAARLEGAGYDGDAYRFCEGLVTSVLADGYRRLEPPPALHGPSSTEAGREKARQVAAEGIAAARAKRTTVNPPNEEKRNA